MRLLLAEDERALSKALTAILERNNYSVDAVYDGQSALDYLEADNYDGVVLDIMMPKVDGLTVLRKVRERGNLIPIQMLELLMCNPHQLISSERFLEKIWGYDSEAEINVVWVYISYLRKKLSALHADIQIKATRNAGYSLEERS